MKATRTSLVTIDHLRSIDFWTRVDRGSADSCWLWMHGTTKTGYGKLTIPRSVTGVAGPAIAYYAHRVAASLDAGSVVPLHLVIDHTCYNPRCCNPGHLEIVRQRVNARRGRVVNRAKRDGLNIEPRTYPGGRVVWMARYYSYDPDGTRHNRGRTFHSEDEAVAWASSLRGRRRKG